MYCVEISVFFGRESDRESNPRNQVQGTRSQEPGPGVWTQGLGSRFIALETGTRIEAQGPGPGNKAQEAGLGTIIQAPEPATPWINRTPGRMSCRRSIPIRASMRRRFVTICCPGSLPDWLVNKGPQSCHQPAFRLISLSHTCSGQPFCSLETGQARAPSEREGIGRAQLRCCKATAMTLTAQCQLLHSRWFAKTAGACEKFGVI